MHQIPRRRFVKGLLLGTAFSSILGKSWKSTYAATFAPAAQDPTLQISLSDYPALQEELGSVRLGVTPVGPDDFPAGRYYPIVINRDFGGEFYVLNSTCKHAGCVVRPFDLFEFSMFCPCHGSRYDIHGDVEEGPAESPLDRFEFTFDGVNTLTIVVPEMGFTVKSFLPNPQPGTRLQLEFKAEGNVFYEVRFREKLTDPWQPALFSLTPSGLANEEALLGNGDSNTIYLDRTTPTGFYAVAMRLDEV